MKLGSIGISATGQIVSAALTSFTDTVKEMTPRAWARDKVLNVSALGRKISSHIRHRFSNQTKHKANTVTSHVRACSR
jgi:hypothetical protein